MNALAEVTVRGHDLCQCSDVLASCLISTLLHALPSEQENTRVRHKSPKIQHQLSTPTTTIPRPMFSKNTCSCDTNPPPPVWLLGNICNTAPGGRPRSTEL